MATSAIIKVATDADRTPLLHIALYKHWDGAPHSTLPWLEKFNGEFTKKRGINPGYKFAQLIRSSVADAEEFNLDDSKITGWGVVSSSTLAEYVYTLESDGTVSVVNGKICI